MTAAASRSPEPYEVPEGGLASFLTATVGDWSDEALNADNYYDIVKPTADQLAEFGREEDDRIAHVATGETIVPMAVFEEDPALKEALFTRMREMGIDPERYIVGNELNSINPVTGQPEFFLKKIFKGIKKAVKGVVKVFKKVAPIILSTVGFMVAGPLGASLGSGIGTLIQGGSFKDAFKSALIAGATAGITQGIGQGFGAAGQTTGGFGAKLSAGVQGFGESITSGLSGGYVDQFTQGVANITGQSAAQAATNQPALTAADAVQQGAAGTTQPDILNQLQSGQFTTDASGAIVRKTAQPDILSQLQSGQFTTDASGAIVRKAAQPSILEQLQAGQFTTDASGAIVPKSSVAAQPTVLEQLQAGQFTTDASGAIVPKSSVAAQPTVLEQLQSGQFTTDASGNIVSKESLMQGTGSSDPGGIADLQGTGSSDPGGINVTDAASSAAQQTADRTFMQKVSDYMFRGGQTPAEVQAAISSAKADAIKNTLTELQAAGISRAAAETAAIKAGELAAAKAGPGLMARFGPSALALTGIGAAAGFFDPPEMEPLPDAFGGLTGQKLIDMYPSQYTLSAPGAYVAPSMAAADGGGIDTSKFPRRNGRISGPGTETSDDIPAMLSDGEFVMTAKAVRGAGNGSREAGMRNMYNMMSRFEGNA